MEPLHAVSLGIVQGLTEFLPISSSGHLVLLQTLFGLTEPELIFDIGVHVGTLVAVVIFFRRDLLRLIGVALRFPGRRLRGQTTLKASYENELDIRLISLIIIGTIPTVICGLALKPFAERIFSAPLLTGIMLLVTGSLLWATRRIRITGHGVGRFGLKSALAIGLVQGLAIFPGISRSGSTIAAGLFLRLNRETAARYSFLLAIPAILGAAILQVGDLGSRHAPDAGALILGAGTSAVVGYGALRLLVYIVNRGQLHLFAPYCWIIGAITVVANLI
jgi:undecaprenyl-diphosphatase